MSPQPKHTPEPDLSPSGLRRLATAADMAREHFGNAESLAVVQKTTLELAQHYADTYNIDMADPEVTVISVALAQTRHKEFLLMQELERELHDKVLAASQHMTYGEALFRAAKSGSHDSIHRELTRLHGRAKIYHEELATIAVPPAASK